LEILSAPFICDFTDELTDGQVGLLYKSVC